MTTSETKSQTPRSTGTLSAEQKVYDDWAKEQAKLPKSPPADVLEQIRQARSKFKPA